MANTPSTFDYDVAVLGGGSAGYAAARTAAADGLKTVVIEGADEVGGLCILRGCMPTKALLQAADVRHIMQKAAVWGIESSEAEFNFANVMARKDALITDFASYRREQLSGNRFKLIRQSARFQDPHTLALRDGSRLTSEHFVIATGSRVSSPPLQELANVGCLTSDDALTLESPPRSLIILGGGPIALEFAQFFRRFDVEVTVVQRSNHVLKEFDEEAAVVLEEVFQREGVTLHTGTQLVDAREQGSVKTVVFEKDGQRQECQAEAILLALGRSPNTADLGLDLAGVQVEKQQIVTSSTQQTSAPHIYAAGDCCGPYEIVHIAIQQGENAAHNIANPAAPRQTDYRLLISVVFTDPQLATVGLTGKQATAQGVPHIAAAYPFNDHGKSMIMDAMDGFVKLLADPVKGEILGGTCVGPMGGELIHEIVAAMHKRMTVHELAAMPHYHPTLAEIWTYPAEELADQIVIPN